MPDGEAESPDRGHWEDEDEDVEEDVCDGGSEEGGVVVDAFAVRVGSYPCGFDGYALKYVGKDYGYGPAGDEGGDDVAGVFEHFVDAEETVVEE